MLTDLLQYLVNGLIVGALIALPALGLTLMPVTFPPGRLKLATRPSLTGSPP